MESAMKYQSVDEPLLGAESPKRTWMKPTAIFTVVLVVCVGFLFVAGDKTNTLASSPNVALFAENANAQEDTPMPVLATDPIEDATMEAAADIVPGSVVGRGVYWVSGPRRMNCNSVCARRRMSAVVSGHWPSNKKPFYVCGARGTRRHPGMRTGFNLPGWNNGRCAIAYGRWVNRVSFKCLCRKRSSRSRWVSNRGRYSSCRRVCEKESPKMVAVSSGAYLNRENNPRFEVCAACRGYDCRAGWNLGLIKWGDYCVSPHGRTYTKTTGFKCFCAVPAPCRPRPPLRCPVRVRVISLGAFYRYWKASVGDHFYTRNAREIGTTKPGSVGNHGYKSEGIACYLAKRRGYRLVPLYRYWKPAGSDHFYTTNWREIGTRVLGRVGKHGYKYEGVAGYCSPRALGGTVPFFRYWNARITDHFYTTNWGELGPGRHGWAFEGIQCYVWKTGRARLVLAGLAMEGEEKMMKAEGDEAEEAAQGENEKEEENEELDADADLGEELADTQFHIKDDAHAEEKTQ